jgi:hypothetical protein
MKFGHWTYKDNTINPKDYFGFVYCITNTIYGRKYLGKKQILFKTCKSPLKGRVNKRRSTKPSNWETYVGSCKELQQDINKFGKDKFEFEILYWCESKLLLSYMEVKFIIDNNAIFSKDYYNQYIGCRLRNKK